MTNGDGTHADVPINLRKGRAVRHEDPGDPPAERVEEARQGPAWLVIPIRVVALVVFVPLRLVYDLMVQAGRGVRALWNRLMRAPGRFARFIGRMLSATWRGLYRWLLAPIGRLVAAVAGGIGAVLGLLIARPARWLAVVVILGFARWLGRGTGRVARWIYATLLAPVGRGLAWFGERALLRPLRGLGRGLLWLLRGTGDALGYLLAGILTGARLLLNALVVAPAVFVWRYALSPAVRGVAWLARVLIVIPAGAVWRYVLAPACAGIVAGWRLAGRALRWLWRTLVVAPARVLIADPARWAGRTVLRPVGHGIRGAWRASVRDPLRAARRTVRQASRDVRLTFRRAFRGR